MVYHIFEAAWSCILGSLRLLLFLITFALTIITVIGTIYMNLILRYGKSSYLEHISITSLFVIPLLILFFGVHGTFYKNATSLKWFSIILTSSAIVTLAGAGLLAYQGDKIALSNIENYLRMHQKNYDWFKLPSDLNSPEYIDTYYWDGIQDIFSCCGIENFKDWDQFKPGTSEVVYPRSCCYDPVIALVGAEYRLCSKNQVFNTGCHESLRYLFKQTLYSLGSMAFLYIGVSFIAYLIREDILQEEADRKRHRAQTSMGMFS